MNHSSHVSHPRRRLALALGSLLILIQPIALHAATNYQAGLGREQISPPLPSWLSGYASRSRPATNLQTELWAKALALQDPNGNRLVLVTTDLIGLPREISELVAERARLKHQLPRSSLILNSSHTHAGPAVWPNLQVMFNLNAEDTQRAENYARQLANALSRTIDAALQDLSPGTLAFGRGTATFAINRREPTPNGVRLGLHPSGPVDHDVPVLQVTRPSGEIRAILFGYACHNTTLGGDFYEVDGDYAGAAQRALEATYPGATALFLMLCGGDQNPNPRGSLPLARQHGLELAHAVSQALNRPLLSVGPPIRTDHRLASLDFAPHTRGLFEEERQHSSVFRQRRARLMLEAYDAGRPVRSVELPVQSARLGNQLTLLALGGEVVVDYAHRAKREYPDHNLIVAAYCNDVPCYIPSRRVLKEGGYEAVDSMIYYGQPGPFAESVEETLFSVIRQSLAEVLQH
jgi:neutral ceramidase